MNPKDALKKVKELKKEAGEGWLDHLGVCSSCLRTLIGAVERTTRHYDRRCKR